MAPSSLGCIRPVLLGKGALPHFGILPSRKGNSFDESLTMPGLGWPQVFNIEPLAQHSLGSLLKFLSMLEYQLTTPLPSFLLWFSLYMRGLLLGQISLTFTWKSWGNNGLYSQLAQVRAHAGGVRCSHRLLFAHLLDAHLLPHCFLGPRLFSFPCHYDPTQQIYF